MHKRNYNKSIRARSTTPAKQHKKAIYKGPLPHRWLIRLSLRFKMAKELIGQSLISW